MHSAAKTWQAHASSNVSILVPYQAVDAALAFVYTLILARALGVEGFGTFVTGVSVAATGFLFLDFGTSLAVVRDTAARRDISTPFKSSLFLRWMATAVLFLLAILMAMRPGFWPLGVAFMVLAAGEGARSALTLAQSALLGRQRPTAVALTSLLEKAAIIAFLVMAHLSEQQLTLTAVAASFLSARVGAALVAAIAARGALAGGTMRPSAAFSYAYATRNIGLFILSERSQAYAIPVLLTATLGVSNTAQFQAAFKVALLPVSFFTAFASAFYPVISGFEKSQSASLSKAASMGLWALITLAGACGTLFAFSGKSLILTIFGAQYQPAIAVLHALIPYILLSAFWQFSIYLLTALRLERTVLRASMTAAVTIPFLIVVLSMYAGVWTGPAALVMGLLASTMVYMPTLSRVSIFNLSTTAVARLLASTLAPTPLLLAILWIWPLDGMARLLAVAAVVAVGTPAIAFALSPTHGRALLALARSRGTGGPDGLASRSGPC